MSHYDIYLPWHWDLKALEAGHSQRKYVTGPEDHRLAQISGDRPEVALIMGVEKDVDERKAIGFLSLGGINGWGWR